MKAKRIPPTYTWGQPPKRSGGEMSAYEKNREQYERLVRGPDIVRTFSPEMQTAFWQTRVKLNERDVEETPAQIREWARMQLRTAKERRDQVSPIMAAMRGEEIDGD